jgi:ABC-type glycerol-3-phosphate transport system substrate-binding protein
MKIRATLAIGLMLFSWLTTACEKSKEDAVKEPVSSEKVIRFWSASTSYSGEQSPGGKLIKQFNEKYKGRIRIESQYMPWEQYNTTIQAAFNIGSLPDVFQLPSNLDLRVAASKLMIQPIDGLVTDEWKRQFTENSFEEGINVIGGRLYSWPLRGPQMNSILYYNRDLLQQSGFDSPPATWDELRDMALKVTKTEQGKAFGFVMGMATPKETRFTISGLSSLDTGTNPEDDWGFDYRKGSYLFDRPEIVKTIQFLEQLKSDGSMMPASYTLKAAEAAAMFGKGKAAFLITGRY